MKNMQASGYTTYNLICFKLIMLVLKYLHHTRLVVAVVVKNFDSRRLTLSHTFVATVVATKIRVATEVLFLVEQSYYVHILTTLAMLQF